MQILIFSAIGALVILFAFYGFHLAAFSYVFTGGAARFWFSLAGAAQLRHGSALQLPHPDRRLPSPRCSTSPSRRSRYFGNTAPLLMVLALAPHRHHADRHRAVALGAAIPLHLPRRRLRRRAGNPLPQALPRAHRRNPRRPGDGVPHRSPAARPLKLHCPADCARAACSSSHGFIWYSSGGTPPAR